MDYRKDFNDSPSEQGAYRQQGADHSRQDQDSVPSAPASLYQKLGITPPPNYRERDNQSTAAARAYPPSAGQTSPAHSAQNQNSTQRTEPMRAQQAARPTYTEPNYTQNHVRPEFRPQPPRPHTPPLRASVSEAVGETAQPIAVKKKKRSGLVVVLCSVAAACLLFAGGAVIGNQFGTGRLTTDGAASAPTQNDTLPPSQTPQTAPGEAATGISADNYDVSDGLSGEEIYQKVSPAVVSIITKTATGSNSGSGVIMSEDGYIITNAHVVSGATEIVVQLNDGTRVDATLVGTDEKTDLAVLRVQAEVPLTVAQFGDSDKLSPGAYAYAIGSPGGVELANTITGGRISAINRDITIDDRVMSLIQTDASINPGNSGGALINKYGEVVGITTAKLGISYYEGLGFAIPINTARVIVDELIENGYIVGRPSIGITGQNTAQGVYIYSVDSRARAAKEGLQAGDIITKVDGQTITTMDDINKIKETKKAGDKLAIEVYRMSTGASLTLNITLTDAHDLEGTSPEEQQQQQQQQYGNFGFPYSYFFGW